jgi:tetratricopeptide (TPR) repeat protein
LAGVLVNRVVQDLSDSKTADLARAEKLIDEGLAAAPGIAWGHYVKGTVLRAKARWQEAISEFETARSLDRNMTGPLQGLGWCKLFTGSLDEVIPLAEEAIRLSPREPTIGFRYLMIGHVYELQSRTDEAITWYEKARGSISGGPGVHAHLASAYALVGDIERATAELAEARRLNGDVYSTIARLKASGQWGIPKIRALFEATYFAGLRKAGMPEE